MSRMVVRTLAGLVLVALAVLGAYAGSAETDSAEQQLPEGQTRVVIPVTGMTCGGCCIPIEAVVKKLDGVVDARADYAKGQATVTYEDDKVSVKKIVEAINTTSFKATLPQKQDS